MSTTYYQRYLVDSLISLQAFVFADNLSFRTQISREVREQGQQLLIDFNLLSKVSKFTLNMPLSLNYQLTKMIMALRSLLQPSPKQADSTLPPLEDTLRKSSMIPSPRRRLNSAHEDNPQRLRKDSSNSNQPPNPNESRENASPSNFKKYAEPANSHPEQQAGQESGMTQSQVTEEDEFVDAYESLTEYLEVEEKKMNQPVKKPNRKVPQLKLRKPTVTGSASERPEKQINPFDYFRIGVEVNIEEYCCMVH